MGVSGYAGVYEEPQWREPEDVWRGRYHAARASKGAQVQPDATYFASKICEIHVNTIKID